MGMERSLAHTPPTAKSKRGSTGWLPFHPLPSIGPRALLAAIPRLEPEPKRAGRLVQSEPPSTACLPAARLLEPVPPCQAGLRLNRTSIGKRFRSSSPAGAGRSSSGSWFFSRSARSERAATWRRGGGHRYVPCAINAVSVPQRKTRGCPASSQRDALLRHRARCFWPTAWVSSAATIAERIRRDIEVGRFSPLTYGRDLRVSSHDPNVLYAALSPAFSSSDGGIFRSDDVGKTWKRFDHGARRRRRSWPSPCILATRSRLLACRRRARCSRPETAGTAGAGLRYGSRLRPGDGQYHAASSIGPAQTE